MIDPTQPPPGEPVAEVEAERRAPLRVIDGPRAGEIWVYDAAKGGYLPADPKVRMDDDIPCMDVGALLTHVRAEVVRPIEEEL